MTARARSRRRGQRPCGALLAVVVVLLGLGAGPRPAAAQEQDDVGPALRLLEPVRVAVAGEPVRLVLGSATTPDGLVVRVHDRVRSRSELARAITGRGLRTVRSTIEVPADALVTGPNGAVGLALPTDGTPGGLELGPAGVYPLTVTPVDEEGDDGPVALVTQLVVAPGPDAQAPALGVAVVADLAADPARSPEGVPVLDVDQVGAMGNLVGALESLPDFPLTLDLGPETLVALALAVDDSGPELLARMAALATTQPVLASPFVDVAPDALVGAGLADDLARQLAVGDEALRKVAGVDPMVGTWSDDGSLGRAGLELLRSGGVRRIVVEAGQITPTTDRVFSLARPFTLLPPPERGTSAAASRDDDDITALVVDEPIAAHLASDAAPAEVATRVVAELAALWFEQPTVARAAVLRVDRTTPPPVVAMLESVLAPTGFLEPVTLDAAFDGADPLVDGRGEVRRIALVAGDVERIPPATVQAIADVRRQVASLSTLVPADDPVLASTEADVLRAEAVGLAGPRRADHLRDAGARITSLIASVSTAGTRTITLTSRKGSVPLTFVNGSGTTLSVVLHVRGAKIDVPGGRAVPLELPPGATRVDIDVEARASGSIPLEIDVMSPDDGLLLTTSSYTVQSTAVSGVGIVLSAGALLFLLVWWGRHWREHRRSSKLIPAGPGGAAGPDEAAAAE